MAVSQCGPQLGPCPCPLYSLGKEWVCGCILNPARSWVFQLSVSDLQLDGKPGHITQAWIKRILKQLKNMLI